MSVASPTEDLVPFHPVAVIAFTSDIFLSDWLPEARPSCYRFILGFRGEQIIAATEPVIYPSLVIIPILTGEGAFRSFLSRDFILFASELLFPLGVRLDDLFA